MKALRLLLVVAVMLTACKKTPQVDDQEVERRVQQRLAEEKAKEREQQLTDRERQLDQREQDLAAQQQPAPVAAQTAEAPAAPEAPAEPARVEVETYQVFYDALAPYGAWIELENYGYVWQPRVALQNNRWRPYTVGHWAYTDYGWTWMSDEPWGWATYHYGRWARLRRLGWVWVPGDEWAPAWVSWRYSDRYIGWAPLPPGARFDGAGGIREWADEQFDIATDDYVFVPGSEFGDDDLADVTMPPEQNVTVFSDTVNVTNIFENNDVIFVNGPNYVVVNAVCKKPIAKLKVERKNARRGGDNKAEVKGQTVQIAAPKFSRSTKQPTPAQVSSRTADTTVRGKALRPQASPAQSATTAQQPQASPAPNTAQQQQRALQEAQRAQRQQQIEAQRAAREQARQLQQNQQSPPPQPQAGASPSAAAQPDARAIAEQQRRALQEAQARREQQLQQHRPAQQQQLPPAQPQQAPAAPQQPDPRVIAEQQRALQEAAQAKRQQEEQARQALQQAREAQRQQQLEAQRVAQEQRKQQQEEARQAAQQARQEALRQQQQQQPQAQPQPQQNAPVERPHRPIISASPSPQ